MLKNPFVSVALAAYSGLGLLATLAICFWLDKPDIVFPGLLAVLGGILAGLIATIPVEIVSIGLFRFSKNTRDLSREMRVILGRLTTPQIAVLALASGFGEEILFRGLLQTWLSGPLGTVGGLVVASVIFGLLHIPPKKRLAGWMVFAGVMGLYLGVIFIWTGNIIAPAITHALVNFLNLHVVAELEPLAGIFRGRRNDP